ncbi:MAG: tyrosine-type recombinase/integrase [Paludibacteraceae bacterium]|mgnify:CR=1 FL=1|nr:tyrosine-type recombinase/integrase [Paludibacteraceae bacterium]
MLISKFLQYIKYEKGYSSHTFISYKTDLDQFRDFVESQSMEFDPAKVDSTLVREWEVSLMEAGEKASSVGRKMTALKSFFKYLKQHGFVTHNPMRGVTSPKKEKVLPKFLRESEMDDLLSEEGVQDVFGKDFEGVRDRLIVEMFYTLGIRLSELIGIKDVDVNVATMTVLITGKRNKQRLIPFGTKLGESIAAYEKLRDEVVPRSCDRLFVRESGEALYPMLVYRVVTKYITLVSSLSKRSPHVLRHTFATAMLNNGAELSAVKELLGHASLAATEVYTHTTFEQLRKIYKQAHPRA